MLCSGVRKKSDEIVEISTNYQGKGFAAFSSKIAMVDASRTLNLNKLSLVLKFENERAINVYAKLGFKKEGVLIKEFFVDGTYRDAFRMAIFQNEYLEIKNYS